MSIFIMTLSLFKAPSSGGAFPFQRPAEIVGLPCTAPILLDDEME